MELDTMSNNSSNLAASENRAVNSSNMMTSMLSNSENANDKLAKTAEEKTSLLSNPLSKHVSNAGSPIAPRSPVSPS